MPAQKDRRPDRIREDAQPANEFEVPVGPRVEALDLGLDTVLLRGATERLKLVTRMKRVHLVRGVLRIGLEKLVVDVERVRHHLRVEPHELDLLLEPRARDPELNDWIAPAADQFGQPLPTREVDLGETPAVRLDLVLEVVDPMVVHDARAGFDRPDVFVRDRVEILDRRHQRIAGIRHGRVNGDRDDQLVHASSSLLVVSMTAFPATCPARRAAKASLMFSSGQVEIGGKRISPSAAAARTASRWPREPDLIP